MQCQLEAGKRNLAESLSRIQAEFLNSRRQSAADQDNFFNYVEERRKGEEGKVKKVRIYLLISQCQRQSIIFI